MQILIINIINNEDYLGKIPACGGPRILCRRLAAGGDNCRCAVNGGDERRKMGEGGGDQTHLTEMVNDGVNYVGIWYVDSGS